MFFTAFKSTIGTSFFNEIVGRLPENAVVDTSEPGKLLIAIYTSIKGDNKKTVIRETLFSQHLKVMPTSTRKRRLESISTLASKLIKVVVKVDSISGPVVLNKLKIGAQTTDKENINFELEIKSAPIFMTESVSEWEVYISFNTYVKALKL
ncbi:hypothetical protein [Olleya sp. Bg11-27]|uniref:hypothetical protein n=1 Tax=Olleya sp. Bg11-27 TaxID=2058135 RepID=UPI000C3057D9|nr:hypothetical protein [Olleya sp. Bg11-27]AUC74713.1 hypothetical protein CW732_03085 [Olleya sp. Bg11-27]